jgi:hypothetical protein
MQHPLLSCALAALVCCGLTGCATLVTRQADLAKAPKGVRVYPPKVYLMVDAAEKKSTLAFLPDFARAYDVKPVSVFAKQDFEIEFSEGQLKSVTANQDTTAILSLFKEGANLAAKAAGVGVSSSTINGTFGLDSGVYALGDDGAFRKLP